MSPTSIQQRCPIDPAICDMKVTAICVGWRGARVDEPGLKRLLGETLGGSIGPLSAGTTLADAAIACPPPNRWLSRARAAQKDQYGLFWQSDVLAPPVPGAAGQGKPAARFFHGLQLTGMAPITRANDPLWKMRAFDNELSRHDSYRLTSFICAIDQLVLDDSTGAPAPSPDATDDPDHPMVTPTP